MKPMQTNKNMQPKYATNATNQCTQTQLCNQSRVGRAAGLIKGEAFEEWSWYASCTWLHATRASPWIFHLMCPGVCCMQGTSSRSPPESWSLCAAQGTVLAPRTWPHQHSGKSPDFVSYHWWKASRLGWRSLGNTERFAQIRTQGEAPNHEVQGN